MRYSTYYPPYDFPLADFSMMQHPLLSWEWYDEPKMCRLFVHLLLTVQPEEKKYHGILLKPGQRIASIRGLSEETGLSERSVRTCLRRMKEGNYITFERHSKITVIQVNEHEIYEPLKSGDTVVTQWRHSEFAGVEADSEENLHLPERGDTVATQSPHNTHTDGDSGTEKMASASASAEGPVPTGEKTAKKEEEEKERTKEKEEEEKLVYKPLKKNTKRKVPYPDSSPVRKNNSEEKKSSQVFRQCVPGPSEKIITGQITYLLAEYQRMSGRRVYVTEKWRPKLRTALKTFSVADIRKAWAEMAVNDFLRGKNDNGKDYFTLEFAVRLNKIEQYLNDYHAKYA